VPFDALFVRLFALALREHAHLNATIEGESIVVLEDIHLGFAVASAVGLLVPVIRHADTRSSHDVTADVRTLRERACRNQLQSADTARGTVGAYSVDAFSAIINRPSQSTWASDESYCGRLLKGAADRSRKLHAQPDV
jgi:pyruvate dehydrogenase E2 component (dihydrolipoamide acetyltransferase)